MFKEQKGVTLIALVITIIVLVILAGVSIAMLTGDNGILNKSTKAAASQKVAEARDLASTYVATQYTTYLENKYTKNASEAFTLGTLSDNGNFSIAAGSTSNAEEAAGIITLTPKAKDDNGADVTVTGKVSAQGVITWSDITK